jgi:hypothetical protein
MPSSSVSASNSRAAAVLALVLATCGGGSRPTESGQLLGDGGDPGDGPPVADLLPGEAPPRPCTLVLPTCPATGGPSYATQIKPLVARRCLPSCHEPGGIEQMQPLGSYPQIYAIRRTVLTQVYGCKMPPPEKPALPDDEANTILTWLVCAAPNN